MQQSIYETAKKIDENTKTIGEGTKKIDESTKKIEVNTRNIIVRRLQACLEVVWTEVVPRKPQTSSS